MTTRTIVVNVPDHPAETAGLLTAEALWLADLGMALPPWIRHALTELAGVVAEQAYRADADRQEAAIA